MVTHSRMFAYRIPWTEEPGRLQTDHRVTKSQTRLNEEHFLFFFQENRNDMFSLKKKKR